MSQLSEAMAKAPPQQPAFDDGVRQLTWREVDVALQADAAWLGQQQVSRCALLAENGCAWAIADLALLQLAAVNLPLPTFFTPLQKRHALEDAGVNAVLTDNATAFLAHHPEFRRRGVAPGSQLELLTRDPVMPPRALKITYTSGSTGTPKGVCLTAETLWAVSASLAHAVRGAGVSRHLCLLPLSTLLENLTAVHVPLLLGATSLLPPAARTGMSYGAFDPRRLLAAIAGSQARSLVLVPELLRALVAVAGADPQEARGVFQSLRFIAVGGATVSPVLLEQAEALGLPVFEGYGLSECGSVVCLNTPQARRRGSVGKPLPHVRLRVDAEGEIHVSSEAFGEIATGDLGEIDADGYVYVRGRRRNRFITSFGRNVTPEWVERELRHEPQFALAMVVGEARPWVAALLWPSAAGSEPGGIESAIERVNARLPDYAQVRGWVCAPDSPDERAQLLTANGRLRREAVLARHGARLEALYTSEAG
jgi:long-chain acyl-CoA synthetase